MGRMHEGMIALGCVTRFFGLNSLKMNIPQTSSLKRHRRLLVVLAMLFATVAVAQRPLDRGIHKRRTGGVSILFGQKNKASNAVAFEGCRALQPQAPVPFQLEDAPDAMLQRSIGALPVAAVPTARRWNRVMHPLKRLNSPVVERRKSEKRLLLRLGQEESNPTNGSAPYDWASIVGFVTFLLGFLVAFISKTEVILGLSLLMGFIFGAIGLKRTKVGDMRGRGLALAGFIPGLVGLLVWSVTLSTVLSGLPF